MFAFILGQYIKKNTFLFSWDTLWDIIFFVQLTEISAVVSLNYLNLNQIICDFNILRMLQNKLEILVKIFRLSDGVFDR